MLQIVSEYLQVCDVYLRPQYDVINNSKRKVIQNRGLLLLHYRFDHLLLKNQQKITIPKMLTRCFKAYYLQCQKFLSTFLVDNGNGYFCWNLELKFSNKVVGRRRRRRLSSKRTLILTEKIVAAALKIVFQNFPIGNNSSSNNNNKKKFWSVLTAFKAPSKFSEKKK